MNADFSKVLHPADIKAGALYKTRSVPVFCKVEYKAGRLSISGVEGPLNSGNCAGGCGQIDMNYKTPEDRRVLVPAAGWTRGKLDKFFEVWERWHLNDMRSACEHQRALGWKYEDHRGVWVEVERKAPRVPIIDEYDTGEVEIETKWNEFKGHACPVCGYSIGSAWLTEDVPADVLEFLSGLPNTDKTPAWV